MAELLLKKWPRRRAAPPRRSWWGRGFARSIEELSLDPMTEVNRLARGGVLGAIVVIEGHASCVVEPPGEERVLAQLRCRTWTDLEWQRFTEVVGARAGHVAALGAGTLPHDLAEELEEIGVELLPDAADFDTACECDAWTQPCRHAVALGIQLTWRMETDPWVLLLLRGRSRDDLEAALAEYAHGAAVGPDQGAPANAVQNAAALATQLLVLAEEAPSGHGLADALVAAYDERVAVLLDADAPEL